MHPNNHRARAVPVEFPNDLEETEIQPGPSSEPNETIWGTEPDEPRRHGQLIVDHVLRKLHPLRLSIPH